MTYIIYALMTYLHQILFYMTDGKEHVVWHVSLRDYTITHFPLKMKLHTTYTPHLQPQVCTKNLEWFQFWLWRYTREPVELVAGITGKSLWYSIDMNYVLKYDVWKGLASNDLIAAMQTTGNYVAEFGLLNLAIISNNCKDMMSTFARLANWTVKL